MKQWKYSLKVVFTVLMILVLPALFFQYIGDEPTQVRENATRVIAVVNEDLGVEDDDEFIRFGDEVTAAMNRGSAYDWTVVGRSAAENGLKNGQYDAIVYIPSSFSQNILTYNDPHPKQANMHYEVHDQLNAVNRQRVLREIEDAANKVNQVVATLYWSYFSQDVEHLRKQFDNILQKEIEFQEAMFSFYHPASQSLADEISRQKELMEQLQADIQLGGDHSYSISGDSDQVLQYLMNFVHYVERYQAYQEEQRELFTSAQLESSHLIEAGMDTIISSHQSMGAMFHDEIDPIVINMEQVHGMMEGHHRSVHDLSQLRFDDVDGNEGQLRIFHGDLIDLYQQQVEVDTLNQIEQTLASLRQQIQGNGTTHAQSIPSKQTNKYKGTNHTEREKNIQKQREKLATMSSEMIHLRETLKSVPDEHSEEIDQVITGLGEMTIALQEAENELRTLEDEDPSWQERYEQLLVEYEELSRQYDNLYAMYEALIEESTANLNAIIETINEQERYITSSDNISESRRERLSSLFSPPINSDSVEDMLSYYFHLSHYSNVVTNIGREDNPSKESVLNSESMLERLRNILSIDESEREAWEDLQIGLTMTEAEIEALQQSTFSFIENFGQQILAEHSQVTDTLTDIRQSADTIHQLLQNPIDIVQGGSDSEYVRDGTVVVSLHETVGHGISTMGEQMETLSERQANIAGYTVELHHKVSDIEFQAERLNASWAQNVETTGMVKNDVDNLLGNAFIDGQDNSYVYNHLANPLQISGDAPRERERVVPPVIILVIVLVTSLLIGYFGHYYRDAALWVRAVLIGLLNVSVGLMISIFGLNIYELAADRAIMWSIFTIALLLATSTVVRIAFKINTLVGWFISVAVIMLFITPLLDMSLPNFHYVDPISKVYLSIQHDVNTLFVEAMTVLLSIIIGLTLLPWIVQLIKSKTNKESVDEDDQFYQA